jgi:hypothetical protein
MSPDIPEKVFGSTPFAFITESDLAFDVCELPFEKIKETLLPLGKRTGELFPSIT